MKLDRFFISLTAMALATVILLLLTILSVVIFNGTSAFWPKPLHHFKMVHGEFFVGEIHERQPSIVHLNHDRFRIKVANRDLNGIDFRWIEGYNIQEQNQSPTLVCIERMEYGDFFATHTQREPNGHLQVWDAQNRHITIPKENIVRLYRPNQLSLMDKLSIYGSRFLKILSEDPREANTEGGLFPAIFGTILLIFTMSILSFPFGVIAGIYMSEYANDGWLLRAVRIAVNNLAGIPSIVFGIFGLGFFVYSIGNGIDQVLFADNLPAPTFGTGGILWASLTLGLLTVPVVIVSTEEALGVIPTGVRESSMALGASQLQTLVKVILPMASPGILTGFILAMSRAAGEVAPLMMTGVVKLAPSLPLDGEFPFIHLDRKFMHLGFHIYDMAYQSPNVEAALPLVYVTTLLLLVIVTAMTSGAIILRNVMRKKYSMGQI